MHDFPIPEILRLMAPAFRGSEDHFSGIDSLDPDKNFLLLSYRQHFDVLWRLEPGLLEWLNGGPRTVVLVWEETPSGTGIGPVNIGDYITAFDWGVALALLASDR